MTRPDLTDVLARLDRRVADAAEAWLADPRDTGIYTRLVAAVTERRAVLDTVPRALLHAVADGGAAVDGAGSDPAGSDAAAMEGSDDGAQDEADGAARDTTRNAAHHTAGADTDDTAGAPADHDTEDADADDPEDTPAVPLRPVGADLLGDPRAVLERLRRG